MRNRYIDDKELLFKHIEDRTKKEAIKTNEEINKSLIDMGQSIENESIEKIKQTTSGINSRINSLNSIVQRNTIEIKDLEIELTAQTGVKANLLNKYFQQAYQIRRLEISDYDWKLSMCLDEIIKLFEEGVTFHSVELPEFTEFLNKLPDQFSETVHVIRERLRKFPPKEL